MKQEKEKHRSQVRKQNQNGSRAKLKRLSMSWKSEGAYGMSLTKITIIAIKDMSRRSGA